MRSIVSAAGWAAVTLLAGLALAALMGLLRSGGFRDQIGTLMLIVGAVTLAGGVVALGVTVLWGGGTPAIVSAGLVVGALGVLAVASGVTAAVNSAREADAAKPYKIVIDDDAASAAQRAGVDLERLVVRTTERVFTLVPHPKQVKINVRLDPNATLLETGVGTTFGPDGEVLIAINGNPKRGLGRSLTTWLPASLARILFLNSRAQAGPGYGLTLGDALVSEGLSDHFVAEAFPKTPLQPWDHRTMTARQEAGIWKRARIDLIIPGSYDYADWFLGPKTSTALPHWSGYTFAYRLVSPYLAAGRTASQTLTTEAELVYKPYAKAHQPAH